MSERIAIVGASVRAAAESAVRAGFRVAAADLFADIDLMEIAEATQISDYPAAFADWLRSLSPRPGGWLYTGALENHPALVDELAEIAPLWGNSGAVLREVRSPWKLADALRDAGLLFPATQASADGLPRNGSWLAKTGRGASGSGVAVLHDDVVSAETFFQQRVPGQPCSAVFVATSAKSKLLGIVRQLIGESWLNAHAFQYCGAIGPCRISANVRNELTRIGQTLAHHFALRGVFGVDFILDGDRVWTIEVNPRCPASAEIVERISRISVLGMHVAACRDDVLGEPEIAQADKLFGKAILLSRQDIESVADLSHRSQERAEKRWFHPTADLPRVGTRIAARRPVLTLFADGATTEEVVANLKARVAIVERQLYLH